VRRGEKTITAVYIDAARAAGLTDPGHVGEALGTCLGDIGFFLAFRILGGIDAPAGQRLVALFAREMAFVGAAQMLDVWSGAQKPAERAITEEDILALYRHKTGRYSFSLPLVSGALLAGREDTGPALEAIGEDLGIIFQLKDDELDLFGEAETIGKPIGSDLREGKHTLLFARLLQKLAGAERRRFMELWGNHEPAADGVEEARRLVREYGVLESVTGTLESLAARCRANIEALALGKPEKREPLFRLLEESLSRKR
jgi:geranylgeranyl diphosphate synthase type I